jgi:hypothetical protein
MAPSCFSWCFVAENFQVQGLEVAQIHGKSKEGEKKYKWPLKR